MEIANGSFPLEWDNIENRLYAEGKMCKSSSRKIGDMLDVLYDEEFARAADGKQALYFMHRDVHKAADEQLFAKQRRRYDVTVVLPTRLGKEFAKTIGHYHELASLKTHQSYPELYEVLQGTAHILIFRRKVVHGTDDDRKIEDCALVEATAGQKVFVPPNYGHIMINPTNDTLVTDNLVEWQFGSLYDPVGKMHGGPYFELADKSVVPNEEYSELPELKRFPALEHGPTKALGLETGKSVYDLFASAPDGFGFLEP